MQTYEELKKQIEDHSQELGQELNEYIERKDSAVDEIDWIIQKIAAFEVLQSNTMEQLQVIVNSLNTMNETLAGTKKDEPEIVVCDDRESRLVNRDIV